MCVHLCTWNSTHIYLFVSIEDAAKLLDEDQKKFEESHQFDKQVDVVSIL